MPSQQTPAAPDDERKWIGCGAGMMSHADSMEWFWEASFRVEEMMPPYGAASECSVY